MRLYVEAAEELKPMELLSQVCLPPVEVLPGQHRPPPHFTSVLLLPALDSAPLGPGLETQTGTRFAVPSALGTLGLSSSPRGNGCSSPSLLQLLRDPVST